MKSSRSSLGCLLIIVLGLSSLSYGQSDRGTITGSITDSSGAVVPDAVVTVTHISTDTKTIVTSTSSGNYTVPQLQSGTYKIAVERQGFKTAVRESVPLLVGQTIRENIILQVGEVSQTVEVEAVAPLLKPETSEL